MARTHGVASIVFALGLISYVAASTVETARPAVSTQKTARNLAENVGDLIEELYGSDSKDFAHLTEIVEARQAIRDEEAKAEFKYVQDLESVLSAREEARKAEAEADEKKIEEIQAWMAAKDRKWEKTLSLLEHVDKFVQKGAKAPALSNHEAARKNFCLDFDGEDDYAVVPDVSLGAPVTVEAWVWTRKSLGKTSHIIGFNGGASSNIEFGIQQDGSKLYVSNGDQVIVSRSAVPSHTWVHVAFTSDLTGHTALYINGIADGSGQFTFALDKAVRSHQTVGRGPNGGFFNGRIVELRMWSVVKKQADIEEDRLQRLDGKESTIAGYWPMTEGNGAKVSDISRNHHPLNLGDGPDATAHAPTWTVVVLPDLQDPEK